MIANAYYALLHAELSALFSARRQLTACHTAAQSDIATALAHCRDADRRAAKLIAAIKNKTPQQGQAK